MTIGGGTGTFVVLSGLRTYPDLALTAIVSSADDGGSTGRLRDAYGILPPGDARQALAALAEEDGLLRELFNYRFSRGDVSGHTLGNLLITALADTLGSTTAALEAAARILRIDGRVVSVSDDPTRLVARLADGTELLGEHAIDTRAPGRAAIAEVRLAESALCSASALSAVEEADIIVLGPGDLYTSTIAPLLPEGMRSVLAASRAKLVYVMNLFTTSGQTDGYAASRYIAEVERYAGRAVDHILIASDALPEEALRRYAAEGERPVEDDLGDEPRVLRGPFVSIVLVETILEDPVLRSLIRHDGAKLARTLSTLL